MKVPITVIILTYNEEVHIARCLENVVGWADEVFVVDSFSTDKTLEIAKKYGAKVVEHKFENQAQQFNWALDNLPIKNEWILRLDADEYLTEELKKEVSNLFKNISINLRENQRESAYAVNGYYIKRRVYFMGRWIRHGGYYPTWLLRLFRKGKARSEERVMDEHLVLLEGKAARLKNDFIDDNLKSLEIWIAKHNNYSSREVLARLALSSSFVAGGLAGQAKQKRWLKENIYYRLPLFWRAALYFFYRYVIRLGFLDGREGLIFHFLQGFWHQFVIDAKIYELKKRQV